MKAGTAFTALDVLELAKAATVEALARTEVAPEDVTEVVWGNVARPVAYHNLARELTLALSLPATTPAFTVGMACASACVAITTAADHVATGTAELVVAGGSESLTNMPLQVGPKLSRAFLRAAQARSTLAQVRSFADVRPADLVPVAPGIRETSTGLTMGEAAERMAALNGITREAQDEWAYRSHALAAAGWADRRLAAEVGPVFLDRGAAAISSAASPRPAQPAGGVLYSEDNHVRRDTTVEKLAALRPVFDRAHGTITAGNASPLTDGGAAVIIASEERARALGLRPLAAIRAYAYAAVDPAGQLLIAPAYAIPIALKRAGLTLADLDLVEMHEAFAAQVLSTFKVLEANGAGRVNPDIVNVMGGSIALGHPFGATGARVVLTLARELARRGGRYGLASVCAAGGNGAAIVIENLSA